MLKKKVFIIILVLLAITAISLVVFICEPKVFIKDSQNKQEIEEEYGNVVENTSSVDEDYSSKSLIVKASNKKDLDKYTGISEITDLGDGMYVVDFKSSSETFIE